MSTRCRSESEWLSVFFKTWSSVNFGVIVMMNFGSSDWRHRRNFLHQGMHFHPMHYSIPGYCTDAKIDKNFPLEDMASSLTEGNLLDRLHSIPDPLKKNLADTVSITTENNVKNRKMSLEVKEFFYESDSNDDLKTNNKPSRSDSNASLTGIAGFFTSFFGAISGAMFHKRPKSPISQYYDCFDNISTENRQGAHVWHASKFEDQNKNKTAGEQCSSDNDNMNNCRAAVAHCENKLNVVRSLLTNKTITQTPKVRQRRPRRVFVEPNAVEDNFEDAFTPDNFISVENEEYVEYYSIPGKYDAGLCEIDAPKTKIEVAPTENTEIVKDVPNVMDEKETDVEKLPVKEDTTSINMPESTEVVRILPEICIQNDSIEKDAISKPNVTVNSADNKQEIISSCEDKMAKLKLLLQGKRKKQITDNQNSTDSAPEPVKEDSKSIRPSKMIPIEKPHDKRFKNPHRFSLDKRKKCRLKRNIQDDILFANEIDSEEISSVENSPKLIPTERLHKSSEESLSETPDDSFKEKEYFDEVKGRFHSSSTTDSEDSFQIVFTDSPKLSRIRRPSDCDSEDSFIVFEDSPDSCYTSNQVFDEESNESDIEESDSELSDSGLEVCKLSHSLSRTVSDLTDDSLYEETDKNGCDELDCAVRTVCEEISPQEIEDVNAEGVAMENEGDKRRGLLLDETRKLKKKNQPPKKVTFSSAPPAVRVMRVWSFAARQARAGHWERHARDRERFLRRIADVDMAVSWVLKPQHRSRVMFQRFMPWWNAQRRKEIAEKKQKEEEEKIRREKEEMERLEREDKEDGAGDGEGNEADKNELQETEDSMEQKETMGQDRKEKLKETEMLDEKEEIKVGVEDSVDSFKCKVGVEEGIGEKIRIAGVENKKINSDTIHTGHNKIDVEKDINGTANNHRVTINANKSQIDIDKADLKHNVDNTDKAQIEKNIADIEGTQNSVSKLNKNCSSISKNRNKTNNHNNLNEEQKEIRNKRINKKLKFLHDQLAEIQQDLDIATEKVSADT